MKIGETYNGRRIIATKVGKNANGSWAYTAICLKCYKKLIASPLQIKSSKCICQTTKNTGRFLSIKEYNDIKYKANKRNIDFNISIKYLRNLFKQQKYKCCYSNRKLTFNSKKKRGTASLDRIDSNKGYIVGNVHWVHKDVNLAKQSLTEIEFANLIKDLINGQFGKRFNL